MGIRGFSILLSFLVVSMLRAESMQPLSLQQAYAMALQNHPGIAEAEFNTRAAQQVIRENRAEFFPQVSGNIDAVDAGSNTRLDAGQGINDSTVFSRESNGIYVTQLLTDFGRTYFLTESAKSSAQAAASSAISVRAQVLLNVSDAYYSTLGAQQVLQVAQETTKERKLLFDQISALAQAKLKSSLDVSFAKVDLEQAKLLLLRAQNGVDQSFARLSTALGYRDNHQFALSDPLQAQPPAQEMETLVASALNNRPDLESLRSQRDAADKTAQAEKALQYPTITAIGAAGISPIRDDRLSETYAAAGININFPLLNGGRLSAKGMEAKMRAQAIDQRLNDQENIIARDVRIAWLDVKNAYEKINVSQQLMESSKEAFHLAQSRYQLGISSIIELSQAQLNQTQAEIGYAQALYDYQVRRVVLNYQVGELK